MHMPTGKQNLFYRADQLQSSSYSSIGENQSIDEKEKAVLM